MKRLRQQNEKFFALHKKHRNSKEREREKFFHVRQEIDPQECRYIIETTPNILIKKSNK